MNTYAPELRYAHRTFIGAAMRGKLFPRTAAEMLSAHCAIIFRSMHPQTERTDAYMPPFVPTKFVNCPLSGEESKAAEKWFTQMLPDWANQLGSVMLSGYKYSLTWDSNNSSFIASLTGTPIAGTNAHKCISARSDDPVYAMLAVLFKHVVVYDCGDWTDRKNTARFT